MELRRIIGNTFFIVLGFLSGCGFDDAPGDQPAPKIEIVQVETFKPVLPAAKVTNDVDFNGLDDFKSLGIPEGWGNEKTWQSLR